MTNIAALGIHPSHRIVENLARSPFPYCTECMVEGYSAEIQDECSVAREAREKVQAAMGGNLFDKIRFQRMASAIERCHMKPHLMRYSIGHHTHDLVTLLIQCWKEAHDGALPRVELLVAGHVHDHPEIITGDVASPIKDLLGEKLAAVDRKAEQWLGCAMDLTEEEALYLHAADRFEFWLWAQEEIARGNVEVHDWSDSYETAWREKPLPWPFMDLMEEVLAKGMPHLNREQLFKAGGLN
jgi:5'-deoxynucleotidase YfbR-like HD superfamily hydrolase